MVNTTAGNYRFGDYWIDVGQRRVCAHGQPLALEAKVYDLLLLLLENRQRALDRNEIETALWGQRPVTPGALTQLVYKARRALGDDGSQQAVIRTVHGYGFQWVAAVESCAGAPTAAIAATAGARGGLWRRVRQWCAGHGLLLLAVMVLLLTALAAVGLQVQSSAVAAHGAPRLALLPIDNATGDPALEWTRRGLPGLIASMLDAGPRLTVIAPAEVAKVRAFHPSDGDDPRARVGRVTGASVVVAGRLRKVAGEYMLTLHVIRRGQHDGRALSLVGPQPGPLALAMVPRLRRMLGLPPADGRDPTVSVDAPDAYLARTYARGVDAREHGLWEDAQAYFGLCAQASPLFLPCRLQLGVTQSHTDPRQARQTLTAVLEDARDRDRTRVMAHAYRWLAVVALLQRQHTMALGYLRQAAPLARTLGDSDLRVHVALNMVDVAARLRRFALGEAQLRLAGDIIERDHLQVEKTSLYNARALLEAARGKYAAAEKATRASLAASVALGNQATALVDAYNLGLDLLGQHKVLQALPLFVYVYRQGRALNSPALAWGGGDNLAYVLVRAGVTDPVLAIERTLFDLGPQYGHQAYAWALRGDRQWLQGDQRAALASARKAASLAQVEQDPSLWINLHYRLALRLLLVDPTALPALATRVRTNFVPAASGQGFAYQKALIQALAAAAGGNRAGAGEALRRAGRASHHDDPAREKWRSAGLAIALVTHDAGLADQVLADFEPRHCQSTAVLRLVRRWHQARHEDAGVARIEARVVALRKQVAHAYRAAVADHHLVPSVAAVFLRQRR